VVSARLDLAVIGSQADATALVTTQETNLQAALAAQGVQAGDVVFSQATYAAYTWTGTSTPADPTALPTMTSSTTRTGYLVQVPVKVTVRDASKVGAVQGAMAGATLLSITSTASDMNAPMNAARAAAMQDAATRAGIYATQGGFQLAGITGVTETAPPASDPTLVTVTVTYGQK
jgi:uncharacterized protein YggE